MMIISWLSGYLCQFYSNMAEGHVSRLPFESQGDIALHIAFFD